MIANNEPESLLQKLNKLNSTILNLISNSSSYLDVVDIIFDFVDETDISVLILNKSKVLFSRFSNNIENLELNNINFHALANINKTIENGDVLGFVKNFDSIKNFDNYKLTVVTVNNIESKLNLKFIAYKIGNFSENENAILQTISAFLSILLIHDENRIKSLEHQNKSIVKLALSTLSYSEIDAIINIFGELEKDSGIIIASKIADRAGLTRSICVSALKKLETSGIIETRSLGVKGTFIKIINEYFRIELRNLIN